MNDSERPTPKRLAPWPTLTERDAGAEIEPELFEGVPPHLERDLIAWVSGTLQYQPELVRTVLNRFRVSWTSSQRVSTVSTGPKTGFEAVVRIIGGQLEGIQSTRELDPLSVLDAIIALHPDWDNTTAVSYDSTKQSIWFDRLLALSKLLVDTGSAWQVDAELRGLYRRVDPTATEAWRQARKLAESEGRTAAAANLETAWREIYGQHPDPSASYSAAVKAVEAVAVPVLAPGTAKTVHAVARKLREKTGDWQFTLVQDRHLAAGTGSADVVSAMLDRLLEGETYRHTSDDRNRKSTQAEAETAVHLAVTLVQWFVSGAIRPTS